MFSYQGTQGLNVKCWGGISIGGIAIAIGIKIGFDQAPLPAASPNQNPPHCESCDKQHGQVQGLVEGGIEYLNKLNSRKGINEHFEKIAEATGSDAYKTDVGNRSISVNVRTRENNTFRPVPPEEAAMNDTSTYPFTFDLTITQRFEASDPMAINVQKAP